MSLASLWWIIPLLLLAGMLIFLAYKFFTEER